MFYKALGFLVWKAAKFYVERKLPSRKLAGGRRRWRSRVATLVAVGVQAQRRLSRPSQPVAVRRAL